MAIQFNFEKAALNAFHQRRQEEQRRKYMADVEGHRNKVFDYNVKRHKDASEEKKAFNEAQMLLFKKFLGVGPAQQPAGGGTPPAKGVYQGPPVPAQVVAQDVSENTDPAILLGANPGSHAGNWDKRPLQGAPVPAAGGTHPDEVSNVELAQKILTNMSKKKKDSNKELNPFVGAATGVMGGESTPSVEVVNTPSVNPYLKYRDVSIYNRDSKDPLLTDADLQPVKSSFKPPSRADNNVVNPVYQGQGPPVPSLAQAMHRVGEYIDPTQMRDSRADLSGEDNKPPETDSSVGAATGVSGGVSTHPVNPYKHTYGFTEAFDKNGVNNNTENESILKQAMENGAKVSNVVKPVYQGPPVTTAEGIPSDGTNGENSPTDGSLYTKLLNNDANALLEHYGQGKPPNTQNGTENKPMLEQAMENGQEKLTPAERLEYDGEGNILRYNIKKMLEGEYLNQQINEMGINNDVPLEKLEFPNEKEPTDGSLYTRLLNNDANALLEYYGQSQDPTQNNDIGNKPILKQAMENGAAEKVRLAEEARLTEKAAGEAKKYTIKKDTTFKELLKWQQDGYKGYDDLIKEAYDDSPGEYNVGDDNWDTTVRDKYLTAAKAKTDARDALTARAKKALLTNPKTDTTSLNSPKKGGAYKLERQGKKYNVIVTKVDNENKTVTLRDTVLNKEYTTSFDKFNKYKVNIK